MNRAIGTWALLLALLLAIAPAAAVDLGPNQHLIPELRVNESIEAIVISAELSLQPEWDGSVTTGIPFGAVMVHTANATTLIFDRNGNHLFSIDDELSAKIPTPAGVEKPCTRVHPLPNDSRVYHHGDVTFVFDTAGDLILTIIDESPKPDEEPITIEITSLHEGGVAWIDVAPVHVAVAGEVHAPAGVHSVVVRSGSVEVSCGNAAEFACSVPVSFGKNTITVVATDNRRHRAEKTVNLTVHSGTPPPLVAVSGRVTDAGGSPVPGALVRFESVFDLGGEPIAAMAVTGEDGRYLVEDALGYRQTVTVEKEGYSPHGWEVVFENLTNTLDLELEPSSRTVPGFGPAVGVLGLLGARWILRNTKRQ